MPENAKDARDNRGRFLKGRKSPNPGGRPKSLAAKVREIVGEDGERLIRAHWLIAQGDPALRKAFFGERISVRTQDRLAALSWLTDRGWGKPTQEVTVGGSGQEPLRVVFGGRYRPDGQVDATPEL